MKKIIVFTTICFILLSIYSISYCIDGDVQIPNKEGYWDRYTDIYTYDSLYSVLEDLSVSYQELLRDYNYDEKTIEELGSEIKDKEDEISDLKQTIKELNIEKNNKEHDNSLYYILGAGAIIFIIYYIKELITSRRTKNDTN